MQLNPEAPEFYPGVNAVVSAPYHNFSLPYQLLPYDYFFPSSYPFYPYQQFRKEAEAAAQPLEEAAVQQKPYFEDVRQRNRATRYVKKKWRVKPRDGGNIAECSHSNSRKFAVRRFGGEKHHSIPLKCGGNETTVMIRNIPNRYTRDMLKDLLQQHCMVMNRELDAERSYSAIDFLYLPIDFGTKSNKGYAFVNFTNPIGARKIFNAWHNKPWERFKSQKIRQICCAKLQGMKELWDHFKNMEFPAEAFQPISFEPAMDGSKKSVKETRIGICINIS